MLLAALLACTGSSDDTSATTPTGDPGTLTAVQAETFTPSCAFAACHSATNPASGLDLTAGTSWGALVNVAAQDAPDEVLVIPGDSAGSYLVKKCSASPDIVGDPMPDGSSSGLDAERLAHLIAWIDAGAMDD